jgi:hypothetical protein
MKPDRKKAGIAALAVIFGVALWLVVPAFASEPGHLVAPASTTAGVYPYDVAVGGTGDCANLFTGPNSLGTGVKEYDNVNPKTTNGTNLSSGNNDNVKFGLTMNTDSNKNQTLEVRSTGAAILGIGIKGGTQSTAYDYKHTSAGFVTSDTGLHGPLQSFTYNASTNTETGSQFYSISQLSVCYTLVSYIQGTVYHDVDQSGGFNSGDTRPAGWTVRLYKDVTPGTPGTGTLMASASTVATGSYSYHFDLPVDGTHYRVCEIPTDPAPTGTDVWVETQPLPSTATLCGTSGGQLAKGYDFTPTSSAGATDDFGNIGGFSCSLPAPVGLAPYTVGQCKPGQTYVFNFGTLDPGTVNAVPFVDYWVGDPSQANVPVVEQLNFDDPIVSGQPKNSKLLYADGGAFPVSLNSLRQMNYCQVDPRTPSGTDSDFALSSSYDTLAESGAVLPTGETSCVISIRTTAPLPPDLIGKLQAYVYALGDSVRTTG